jgi:hypothetical protein
MSGQLAVAIGKEERGVKAATESFRGIDRRYHVLAISKHVPLDRS